MNFDGKKTVITCAVTGGAPFNRAHPDFPVTPEQIAKSALQAHAEGAAVVHIHVRDPHTGARSRRVELFSEVCARIRDAGSDVIINLTCGHGAFFLPDPSNEGRALPNSDVASVDERLEHLVICRPEMASLDINTSNQSGGNEEYVYLNTTRTLRALAGRFQAIGVKPELEIFGPGDIMFAKQLTIEGLLTEPPIYQFVMGVKWCMPTDVASIVYLHGQLPPDAVWGALGIGRMQMPVLAQSLLLGGNVRIGLEDNYYLRRGVFASNAELVARARTIVESIGGEVASSAEARAILGLKPM